MPRMTDLAVRRQRVIGPLLMLAVLLGLLGLPIAVWLDLRTLSERLLRLQASETGRIIDDMRGFYASDVVGRVLQAHGQVTTGAADYRECAGRHPDPRHPVDRARQPHQRARRRGQVSLRLRPAVQRARARIRSTPSSSRR